MMYAVLAYLMWGGFAAFFPLLEPASPPEILAHRIVWTAGIMLLLIVVRGSIKELKAADRATWLLVSVASFFIAINWLTYVVAVNSGHVAEAALGYFINPLVNVLLGMVFLGERLRPLQKLSVVIAAIAVIILAALAGQPPLLGLTLAFSFGIYGLIKKRVQLSAEASLAAETLVLFPIAAGYWIYLAVQGTSTFASEGVGHAALLISSGLITAIPLLLFSHAAKLVPLSTIGMLQYMTPTMQMLWAVLVMHEQLQQIRWIGFIIIWVSVAIFLADIWLVSREK
ncbi:EamA-like transporter family protein [Corynebacterium kalinowskii]|uniref:EamA-like transporter family protein n=1 Tax=Corynebacterium kalinowskii TaxID=2675216 RepID=A0A6B8VTU7_9CORY|nr:EamA family transporter RarD [Corynebacterium kalinowskii]QGU02365.1 EamA-like transporter family protein [Corynebacterium kalinowskii]